MAENRKLGRTADHRVAMLKNMTTSVILHGQIETTQAKAKEVKSLVDSMISLAIKEKDNFEMVDKKISRAKVDEKGNKVTEKATSKNGKEFYKVVREEVTESVKKASVFIKECIKRSRLAARRKIMNSLNKVKDENGKNIDLPAKLFDEIAPKYENRKGGYTRIIKLGQRRGDAAEAVILQLV